MENDNNSADVVSSSYISITYRPPMSKGNNCQPLTSYCARLISFGFGVCSQPSIADVNQCYFQSHFPPSTTWWQTMTQHFVRHTNNNARNLSTREADTGVSRRRLQTTGHIFFFSCVEPWGEWNASWQITRRNKDKLKIRLCCSLNRFHNGNHLEKMNNSASQKYT